MKQFDTYKKFNLNLNKKKLNWKHICVSFLYKTIFPGQKLANYTMLDNEMTTIKLEIKWTLYESVSYGRGHLLVKT